MKFLHLIFALCFVTLLAKTQSSCEFSLDSYEYNLCGLVSNNTQFFIDTIIDGNLSFSIVGNNVISCNQTQSLFGVLHDGYGNCYDIATEEPSYTLQNPQNPLTGGLALVFPATTIGNQGFQLIINLDCSDGDNDLENSTFILSQMYGDVNTGFSTYIISAPSAYGCAVTSGCSPTFIENSIYNLCILNNNTFNISDNFGGYLAFSAGEAPEIEGCSYPKPYNLPYTMIYGNYYASSGIAFPIAGFIPPKYSLIDDSNPNLGVRLSFGGLFTSWSMISNFTFDLKCNPYLPDDAPIVPTVNVGLVSTSNNEPLSLSLNATATSSYGCPIKTGEIEA